MMSLDKMRQDELSAPAAFRGSFSQQFSESSLATALSYVLFVLFLFTLNGASQYIVFIALPALLVAFFIFWPVSYLLFLLLLKFRKRNVTLAFQCATGVMVLLCLCLVLGVAFKSLLGVGFVASILSGIVLVNFTSTKSAVKAAENDGVN